MLTLLTFPNELLDKIAFFLDLGCPAPKDGMHALRWAADKANNTHTQVPLLSIPKGP